jgi:hypothetical protein
MTENQSYLNKYGRFNASQAWQEGKAPIVRFVTDMGDLSKSSRQRGTERKSAL